MKVLMVSSNGGHFWQLLSVMDSFAQDEMCLVSFKTPDVESWVELNPLPAYWGYYPTNRSVMNLIRNSILSIRVMRRFRPDLVVTTGAGIAVPFMVLGKLLFGAKTMFVEVFDRVTSASLTGRLVAPFSDWVILQWPEQQAFYNKGTVVGGLLWSSSHLAPTKTAWTDSSIGR